MQKPGCVLGRSWDGTTPSPLTDSAPAGTNAATVPALFLQNYYEPKIEYFPRNDFSHPAVADAHTVETHWNSFILEWACKTNGNGTITMYVPCTAFGPSLNHDELSATVASVVDNSLSF